MAKRNHRTRRSQGEPHVELTGEMVRLPLGDAPVAHIVADERLIQNLIADTGMTRTEVLASLDELRAAGLIKDL